MSRRLIVEADGGSRGNPGVAGYGALVLDPESEVVLAQRAAPLGKASNNVAEYSGLIAGLQAVLDLSLAPDAALRVRMDSKLVVEQMAGRWKIKHADMRRLAVEARDLVRQIEGAGGTVDFEWIPRALNGAADALSNQGMDGEHVRIDGVERVPEPIPPPTSDPGSPAEDPKPAAPAKATVPIPGKAPAFGDARTLDARTSDALAHSAMGARPPAMSDPVRLLLVRHGVTDYTLGSKLDGRGGADPELHALGRAQSAAVASAVSAHIGHGQEGPVSVVTSSLRRAKQTGGAIAEALGVHPSMDADWDEQNFGDWDGRALRELAESAYEDLVLLRADVDYARPGGESHRQLARRVSQAWTRAVAVGGTVVIASHRKPLMCVLSHILGIDHERIWSIATAPCSLTSIDVWPDGGVSVAFVNDTHHLHDLDGTTA